MTIELLVHMDFLPDGSPAWWAESDQLPGFVAQEATLRELLPLAESAARALAAERRLQVDVVTARLADDDPTSQGDAIQYRDLPQDPEERTLGESRAIVREPRELAPV